jgi:hypothetical protein
MAYVLTLLAALAAFVLVTPAHEGVSTALSDGAHALVSSASSQSFPFEQQIRDLGTAARRKGMELLRQQIHSVVDEAVR